MKQKFILAIFSVLFFVPVRADEGMWLPILLKSIEGDMQANGFKLTAEDIYSINKSSMKDAVALFGGGCTAEVISKEGLILTNHHCGFGEIQSHSTVEKDYISQGFWAKNRKEELRNEDLSVSFIVRMEDVTAKVLMNLKGLSEAERAAKIKENIKSISEETVKESYQEVVIRPFYYGNEYYLFVLNVFEDVRLVGAPPQSVGNFGGDTDNWVWPRHNADFCLFRIYADAKGNPAQYSETNIPYVPKYSFPISMKGVTEDDFTMVYGFPGRTQEYISSYAVHAIMTMDDPIRVGVRDVRLAIIQEEMRKNDTIRIQYASKYAGVANGWKKWKGEIKGLKKTKGVEKKQAYESEFRKRAAQKGLDYGSILDELKTIYEANAHYRKEYFYFSEVVSGLESGNLAAQLTDAINIPSVFTALTQKWQENADAIFKDYSPKVDKRCLAALLKLYTEALPTTRQPAYLKELGVKYKNDWSKYADDYFAKSIFTNKARFVAACKNPDVKKMGEDPAWKLINAMREWFVLEVQPTVSKNDAKVELLNRRYMQAQRELMTERKFYPDANSTLRVTYGRVEGFQPDDGVTYKYYTTLGGMLEKHTTYPNNPDYVLFPAVEKLYARTDFGQYADKDGKLHTCFLGSNHTTGGNSGSPVINGQGELIGINFDRCWESTMSDVNYDLSMCRNIAADIRFVLFVIDKIGGAGYLIEEMKLVK